MQEQQKKEMVENMKRNFGKTPFPGIMGIVKLTEVMTDTNLPSAAAFNFYAAKEYNAKEAVSDVDDKIANGEIHPGMYE